MAPVHWTTFKFLTAHLPLAGLLGPSVAVPYRKYLSRVPTICMLCSELTLRLPVKAFSEHESVTLMNSGQVVSPGYPLGYPISKSYSWLLMGASGTYVVLKTLYYSISVLESQGSGSSCSSDYLSVYDGILMTSRPFGRFCGTKAPGVLVSTTNYMLVTFTSDSSNTYKGFYGEFFTRSKSLLPFLV
ncbi:tolloid-like protein 2 [Physella acuta]|uniref:tolloid-like protein 2 n=1 Tax=Physella acuta TaxID=109671 RepID=UPI0027DE62C0|nr:tolloid-like protein 2 [Physella acuta]